MINLINISTRRFIGTIILFTGFLFVSQNAGAQNVTLNLKNAPLKSVLKEIQKQTGYTFVYNDNLIQSQDPVNISVTNSSIKATLDELLLKMRIDYEIVGKQIILSPKKSAEKPGDKLRNITGRVLDDEGKPLVGVAVFVPGTPYGTITDNDGTYSFAVDNNPDLTVRFSFIGMETKDVKLGNQSRIDVSLSLSSYSIENVVVTGYQTISKERATGAFSKVTTKDFEVKRLSSFSNLLEGQVAGYNKGLIRGVTTMNGSKNPLYVIDGFPVENVKYTYYGATSEQLPDINFEDVESITVLKDAAATSIYGARAANGVIVITTKKAARGKTDISFSSSLTYTPYEFYTGNLADSRTMVDIEKEWAALNPKLQSATASAYASNCLDKAIFPTSGIKNILSYYAGRISQAEMNAQLEVLASKGYNYIDQVSKYGKRDKLQQQYNLNVGNASDKNSVYASITYRSNRLEDINSKDESIGINLKNSLNVTKWMSVDFGTYINYSDGVTQTFNLMSPGYTIMPYDDLVNADGTNYTKTATERYSVENLKKITDYKLYNMDITPMDEIYWNNQRSRDFTNRIYTRLNINILKDLKSSTSFQYEYGNYRISQLFDKRSYKVRSDVNSSVTYNAGEFRLPYGHEYYTSTNLTHGYTFRQQLDYNTKIKEKHEIVAQAGFEVRENQTKYNSDKLYNYDPDMLSYTPIDEKTLSSSASGAWGTFSLASNLDRPYFREYINRYVSLYGNAAYTFDSKYTFTGSIRWDRSNLWGTSSKYQNKPIYSVGLSWNLKSEDFFDVDWVDMLKIRLSHGIGGNIAKNSAPYMTASYSNNTTVGGIQGSVSTRPNPSLCWEKTTTNNLGVDFAFFDNRLNGALEIYKKAGEDLLANTMGVPTEGYGYTTYTINNGEMTNKGFEITLEGDLVKKKDYSFGGSFIAGYNKNKVTYVNVKAPVYYLALDYPESYPRIGNPYNAIYGYKWAGLSTTGLPQIYNSKGEVISTQPSDIESIVYLGTYTPVYNGSFSFNARYKNWTLYLQFNYEGGHKIRNTFVPALSASYSSALASYVTSLSYRVNSKITDRWKQAGDETKTNVPRLVFEYDPSYSSYLYTIYSMADINVLDADNLRLSNVSLSYKVPDLICKKIYMSGARLQFNIENAAMWAKSKEAKYMLGGYVKPNYVLGLYLNF